MVDVTHILQGCFTGIGAILWLPQCQLRNPEEYGHITHITLLPKWMIQPQQNKTKQCAYLMGCAVYVFCKDLCHVVIHHKLVCRPGFLLGALMTMGWINGYKWTVSNAVDFVTQLNKQGRLNPTMFISYSRKDYTDRIGIISIHIHLKYKGWVQSSYQSCTRKLSVTIMPTMIFKTISFISVWWNTHICKLCRDHAIHPDILLQRWNINMGLRAVWQKITA